MSLHLRLETKPGSGCDQSEPASGRRAAPVRLAAMLVSVAVIVSAGCSGSSNDATPTSSTASNTSSPVSAEPPSVEPDDGTTDTTSSADDIDPIDTASVGSGSVVDTAIPSTTTPRPLPLLDCTEPPLQIAETLMLQRQRQLPVTGCADGISEFIESSPDSFPCWNECADGSTFVAFQLNDVAVELEILDQETVQFNTGSSVLYVATYLTQGGDLVESAESIRFIEDDAQRLGAIEVNVNDLSDQRASAETALTTYFDALVAEDYATAAELLIGASSVGWEERSDLSRFLQEELVDEQTPEQLESALAQWCEQGALCRTPDRIEYDITPQHGIRGIAQYDTDAGVIESEFFGGTFEGFQEVRGLPPLP